MVGFGFARGAAVLFVWAALGDSAAPVVQHVVGPPRNVVRVGTSGAADASTIAAGVALVPPDQKERWTVAVEAGTYRERVWVNASMGPLTLLGLGATPSAVVLVYHCCPAGDGRPRCSNETVDASCGKQHRESLGNTETLLVEANDVSVLNMTVANVRRPAPAAATRRCRADRSPATMRSRAAVLTSRTNVPARTHTIDRPTLRPPATHPCVCSLMLAPPPPPPPRAGRVRLRQPPRCAVAGGAAERRSGRHVQHPHPGGAGHHVRGGRPAVHRRLVRERLVRLGLRQLVDHLRPVRARNELLVHRPPR